MSPKSNRSGVETTARARRTGSWRVRFTAPERAGADSTDARPTPHVTGPLDDSPLDDSPWSRANGTQSFRRRPAPENHGRPASRIARPHRRVDEQAGQLKVLLTFVQGSLRDQVEAQAQKAAIDAIGRLIEFQGEASPEEER